MKRLTLRTALTAAALAVAALIAAGCGATPEPARPKPPAPAPAAVPAPPAKSEAPAHPAPVEPAEIAWGQTVGGLRAGLVALGGVEGVPESWWQGWECPGCRRRDRFAVEKCDICGCQGRFAAHCPSCTAKYRLCVGCREVRPFRTDFLEGEKLYFEVHLANEGTRDLRLLTGGCSTAPMPWHFELTSKDNGATWSIESDLAAKMVREVLLCSKPSPHETRLAPGGHQMTVLGAHQLLALSKESLKQLPVGRYVVKASYRERPLHDPKQPCPFWHGTVTSGPVEIEIKARPAAAPLSEAGIVARAREVGRKQWPEQVGHAPGGATVLDEKPAVTRNGDTWQVVFQRGAPEIAGARVTVILDACGREVSTRCEWSPR